MQALLMGYFIVVYLVAKPLIWSKAEDDLVMINKLLLFKANYFVITVSRYWSLSQQGHLQLYSKSKAWQRSTQL